MTTTRTLQQRLVEPTPIAADGSIDPQEEKIVTADFIEQLSDMVFNFTGATGELAPVLDAMVTYWDLTDSQRDELTDILRAINEVFGVTGGATPNNEDFARAQISLTVVRDTINGWEFRVEVTRTDLISLMDSRIRKFIPTAATTRDEPRR